MWRRDGRAMGVHTTVGALHITSLLQIFAITFTFNNLPMLLSLPAKKALFFGMLCISFLLSACRDECKRDENLSLPDLTVSINGPSREYSNQPIRINIYAYSLENPDASCPASAPPPCVVRFSFDGAGHEDFIVPSLHAGESFTIVDTVVFLHAGNHIIRCTIDPENSISESDETNNQFALPIEIR